jgi:3-oxoacyl-[acyl-carrier-protein] synthase-3
MILRATVTTTAHNVPKKVMTNFDLEKLVNTSDEWIKLRTGITKRHVVSSGEAASDISTKIAKSLLKKKSNFSKGY